MNVQNMFDYCLNNEYTYSPTIYYIHSQKCQNTLINIAFNKINKKIHTNSNEWLYLLKKPYYNNNNYFEVYSAIVNIYNNISNKYEYDCQHKNLNIIPFITSFSNGTTHGYSGLYFMLNEYLKKKEKFKNYKIIVYKKSQKGILDIIQYLEKKNFFENDQLLYIDNNKLYLFNSIYFIKNNWHVFPRMPIKIIDKYICLNRPSEFNNNICIIKSTDSNLNTDDGVISKFIVDEFCVFNKLIQLNTSINEIALANQIHKAKNVVFSWGTSFFKNYVYLSDICENIIILIIGDIFCKQYLKERHNWIKYKKAKIKFIICNHNLETRPEIKININDYF